MIKTREDLENILRNHSTLYCVTHPGVFHADDVFAMAFFKLFEEYFASHTNVGSVKEVRFIRESDVESTINWLISSEMRDGDGFIIFDIDGGKFDHHQTGSEMRPESTEDKPLPYASFGLVWREFAPIVFDNDFCREFDKTFVKAIDLQDNGVATNPLSMTIKSMNPSWDSTVELEESFLYAVEFAQDVLVVNFDRYFSQKKAEKLLADLCNSRSRINYITMDKFLPYQAFLMKNFPEITYVVYPSNRDVGQWCACPVNSREILFPEDWLTDAGRPTGLTFIHKARFIASFRTREDACRAVELALTAGQNLQI